MPSVLATNSLTTLANLKDFVGVLSTDTSKDNFLERVINRTTLFLESQLNRKLKARRYNNGASTHPTTGVADEDYVYFSGTEKQLGGDTINDHGYGVFYLPAFPVQPATEAATVAFTLSSLSTRDQTGETWDSTLLLENRDYLLNRVTGELRLLSGRFVYGRHNYRVTMCAGYNTSATQPCVPEDLEGLCLEICYDVFNDSRNLQSETIGTWQRTWDNSKDDPYIQGLMAKYSRVVL